MANTDSPKSFRHASSHSLLTAIQFSKHSFLYFPDDANHHKAVK